MFIEDEIYKLIIENTIIEAVDLMIINKKWQLLLWLRNNEPLKWIYYMPWWRRYKNELLMDSVKRKAHEELWLKIDETTLSLLWIYDDIYDNSIFGNTPSHYSSITYVYKINEDDEKSIIYDNQHEELKFFDIQNPYIHSAIQLRITDMKKQKLI